MREVDAIQKTVDHLLNNLGWKVWIANDRIHQKLDPIIYPRHYITIGNFIPASLELIVKVIVMP